MSGHNKWSKIRHKKGAADQKRGRLFSKLIKEITVSARLGGGDPAGNPRLRSAVTAARAASMPNDNIERAVKKGTGELEGVDYEECSYEGYGAGGVAMIVDVVSDNTRRSVKDVRSIFGSRDGHMAAPGAVAWMFDEQGQMTVAKDIDFAAIFDAAVEAGAEDVVDAGDSWLVTTARNDLYAVSSALEAAGIPLEEAKLAKVPQNQVEITEVDVAQKVLRLVESLEDNDDVQTVWTNFDLSDEVLAALDGDI